MIIVHTAKGFMEDPHMVMDAEAGDFLPVTITIHHNGKEIEYRIVD